MSETVIVAIISLAGTVFTVFGGMKLIAYRIEQLEKKVEKHNTLIERMYHLEDKQNVLEERQKVANHRIDDLEKRGGIYNEA